MLNDLNNIHSLEDIRLLYFKYKDTPQFAIGVIILIVLICFTIFGRVVLPQYDRWFSVQNEVKATQLRIATLEQNVALVNSQNQQELTRQFNLSKQALPFEKDYTGIITTIDSVAVTSGVELDDYSFTVGNLSTISANLAPETAISVQLSLKGNLSQIQKFLDELAVITPLSEVVSLSYAHDGAGLGLIFFYKYIPEQLAIPYTDPLRPINAVNQQLLETLNTWSENAAKVPPRPQRDITLPEGEDTENESVSSNDDIESGAETASGSAAFTDL